MGCREGRRNQTPLTPARGEHWTEEKRRRRGARGTLLPGDLAWRLQRNHLTGKKGAERLAGFSELQPPRSSSFSSHSGLTLGAAAQRGVGGSTEGPPHCPVMASVPTVLFLSCWLAGHGGARGQRELPKPLVGGSPSWVVAPGENVTIRCEGRYSGMEFLLRKVGHPTVYPWVESAGTVAEFPLPSVGRADAGSYTCEYRPRADRNRLSHPSDPVEIIVADPSLPRPSVSLSPTGVTVPGADVTIRCQGPGGDVRFFLHQAGDLNRPRHMDPAGDGAEFHIRPVGRQHGGSYSCSYRPRAEPFVSSPPSDPVELVVAGETDLTQPGAVPDHTRPGSAGPEAPPGRPDFTHGNIARLGLGAGILLTLGLILAEAFAPAERGHPRSLDPACEEENLPGDVLLPLWGRRPQEPCLRDQPSVCTPGSNSRRPAGSTSPCGTNTSPALSALGSPPC